MKENTAHDTVIEQIRAMLLDGRYRAGSRLPGERNLAEELGVSRPAVREALRALMNMGVLETRHGAGTVVSASGERLLATSFEFLAILERPNPEDLLDTRVVLKSALAARAASRRRAGDLTAMRGALNRLRNAVLADEDLVVPDANFHAALFLAAQAPLLRHILTGLEHGMRAGMAASHADVKDPFEALAWNEEIYLAIAERDPGRAEMAMRQRSLIA